MDALADRAIAGQGTPEAAWRPWLDAQTIPSIGPRQLVPHICRMVVVAPHPDDEVLAVGGLLAALAASDANAEPLFIAVTDGEASHPQSTEWTRERLRSMRPRESALACRRLGLRHAGTWRLGWPDGGLATRCDALAVTLGDLLRPDDVVFTTWRLDGHPDHEATGRACATACAQRGATLYEVPVWAWHWATPGDARLPWARALRLPLDEAAATRKRHAVAAFDSQLGDDASTGASAILRSTTVQRAHRPFEIFFHSLP